MKFASTPFRDKAALNIGADDMIRLKTFKCRLSHFLLHWTPHLEFTPAAKDLRHCSTLSSFEAKVKTLLFSQYFRPS